VDSVHPLAASPIEEGTPFHPWVGLLQRILVVVWFTCLIVLARRVRRIAREQPTANLAAARGD
jgi:hypothetical protein